MTRSEILQISKPILFNAEMVRAILDGRKTVTRRVIKDKDIINRFDIDTDGSVIAYTDPLTGDHCPPFYPCRYKPGDYLYVRETFFKAKDTYYYKADDKHLALNSLLGGKEFFKWHPFIHMPKEAARIFLRVTDVRVERLKDMTADSAMSEGFTDWNDVVRVWDSTIPPKDRDKYCWAANPWVWVIGFEKVTPGAVVAALSTYRKKMMEVKIGDANTE